MVTQEECNFYEQGVKGQEVVNQGLSQRVQRYGLVSGATASVPLAYYASKMSSKPLGFILWTSGTFLLGVSGSVQSLNAWQNQIQNYGLKYKWEQEDEYKNFMK